MASSARLDELRKKFEENPRRYFAPLANEYRKAGDTEQAIAICREYLPQQPGHMSGHIVFGQALYEARQFEEAKTVFETALSLDPENLIALRHLGDISLILGNSAAARGWYHRVLEADPRNEEIQGQLASLEKAATAAPTPAVTPAQSAAPTAKPATAAPAAKPTPSSAPTVVLRAVKPPTATRGPVTATSPTAEVRLDEIVPPAPAAPAPPEATPAPVEKAVEATLEVPTTSVTQSPFDTHPAPPAATHAPIDGLESHATSAEAPPLDSFSLEGLETTSLASPPPPPAPPVPPLDPGQPEEVPPLDLDLGGLSAPEPPKEVLAATAQEAAPEAAPASAPDLVFISPEAEPEPAPPEPAPVPALELEEPETAAPAAAAEPGPFVTETMAELYLQQGHREEALRVYQALTEQRPGDVGLREKVRRIEAELAPAAPPAPSGGPRFGDVLKMVALRRPGFRPEAAGNGVTAPAPLPELGMPLPEEARPSVPPPQPASGRADALGSALGFTSASNVDENAAVTLATAYTSNGTGGAIGGAPARQASTELSLDSVFGAEQTGPAPPPSSFSFDQFFANRDADSAGGAAAPESAEEVAQFTQWLEGLKRK